MHWLASMQAPLKQIPEQQLAEPPLAASQARPTGAHVPPASAPVPESHFEPASKVGTPLLEPPTDDHGPHVGICSVFAGHRWEAHTPWILPCVSRSQTPGGKRTVAPPIPVLAALSVPLTHPVPGALSRGMR